MIILFLVASATILAVTTICLFLLIKLNGLSLQDLVTEGNQTSYVRIAIQLLAFSAFIGIATTAWLSFSISTSISRSLLSCAEFVRAIANGKFDAPLVPHGCSEAVFLASVLTYLADTLNSRSSKIGAINQILVSIDNELENITRKIAKSAHNHETGIAQTAVSINKATISSEIFSQGIDLMEQSTAFTERSVRELDKTLRELGNSSDKLGTALEEVSSYTAGMAISMEKNSSSINDLHAKSSETASSVAGMTVTIKQIEKMILEASVSSNNVIKDAETGKRSVEEAIEGMRSILNSSRITFDSIQNLWQRVDDIGVILSVIEEVAEQTDLLALNAAIIAAQAGDHGRGFAVVADEIRELAERTSSSTREISSIIRAVQDETRRAVEGIHQAEASIASGQRLSRFSGVALDKIVNGIQKTGTKVDGITSAMVEQARIARMTNESIQDLTEMLREIAASSAVQTHACALVVTTVDRMKVLTNQIRKSNSGEANTSLQLARATTIDTMDAIHQVRAAYDSRMHASAAAVSTLEAVQKSLSDNAKNIKALEASGADLKRQIRLLKKGITELPDPDSVRR